MEVIARLAVGQTIAFHTYSRRTNDVIQYTWDGKDLVHKSYSKPEWDTKIEMAEAAAEAAMPADAQPETVTVPVELLKRLMAGNTNLDAVMDAQELMDKN